jgi:hypothetical protein
MNQHERRIMKLTTTLNLLHKAGACKSRYKVLLTALGTDYPKEQEINLLTILEICGLDDALWALRATAQDCEQVARLMSADFAEEVLPIWQTYAGDDDRPQKAIQAARDYAHGRITKKDLEEAALDAARAAWDAAWAAAQAAWDAARAAAWASAQAARAARAAWAAAWASAQAAAQDAACAAAWSAAQDARAAWTAAWAAARQKQHEIFIAHLQEDK